MTCSDFLARFSEFYDEDPAFSDAEAFRDHLDSCSSCRRYRDVVARGADLLRSLPPLGAREDLHDRLRHSIYSHEDQQRRERDSFGGSGVFMLLAAAAILVGVVWTPLLLDSEPSVDLPPIMVQSPGRFQAPPLPQERPGPTPFLERELWAHSNALLYEHSPLFQRSRASNMIRTGLQ